MAVLFTTLNPAIVYGGSYVDASDLGHAGRKFLSPGQIDVTVTGTAADFGFYDDAFYDFTWTVDGGSPNTYTHGSAGWTTLNLFTGLADAPHTISINRQVVNFWIDEANFLLVAGASPALSTPSGMSPSTYWINDHADFFKTDGTAGWVSYLHGYFANYDYAATQRLSRNNGGCVLRFRATITGLQLFSSEIGQVIRLAIDGVDTGNSWTSTLANFTWVPLATGLDGGAEHEYRISCNGLSDNNFAAVMTVGGTPNLTDTLTDHDCWAFYGDSITSGVGFVPSDAGLAFPWLIGTAKNVGCRDLGAGGTLVKGAANSGETDTAYVTGILPIPTRVVILYGTNDETAILATTETLDEFQTAYTVMVQAIVDGLPDALIHCLGTLADSGGISSARMALNARIPLALADVTGGSNALYIDTTGWIDPSTDLTDSVHPNRLGQSKIAAAYLAETVPAIVLSGPSTGITGSPSTDFTVDAAFLINGDTVTCHSDSGGTFATSPLSFASGNTSQTFKYTPAADGVHEISITDSAGTSISGSPVTYTSSTPTHPAGMLMSL